MHTAKLFAYEKVGKLVSWHHGANYPVDVPMHADPSLARRAAATIFTPSLARFTDSG